MLALLAVLAAVALAAFTYFRLERLDRRAIGPFALRALAGSALALLLVNPSCAARPAARPPLVLLDGSLSMAQRPEAWRDARARADSLGEVRLFGDDGPADSLPTRGRSRLGPALRAAAALDRPVVVITDGELEDVAEIPADLMLRPAVELRARDRAADVALVSVDAPSRLTVGDSLRLEVTVRAAGVAPDSVVVEVLFDDAERSRLARRAVRLRDGEGRATLRAATRGLVPGEHVLAVRLVDVADGEARTDVRLAHLTLVETPGIVLVADPGDWDARFLFRAVRDVAQLPLRGYVRLGDGWRSMADLAVVSNDVVQRAVRGADLVIAKGTAAGLVAKSPARGVWLWPSGATGPVEAADWYLAPTPSSPLAGAFAGLPVDSFAPAVQLTAQDVPGGAWTAMTAQAGRRGAQRPAWFGYETGRRRRVVTAADGLWRWSFRGGASEQASRGLVASTVSWLLGAADSSTAPARLVRAVAQQGRPLVFEWSGAGAPQSLPVSWNGAASGSDSLRFDGAGRAELRLAPGTYRYRLAGANEGVAAVEEYSDEWLPRPVALAAQDGAPALGRERRAARDWPWLLGLAVLALCGEWLVRRRLGLR
ncbi:MAG TPA: hypothetical protein VFY20_10740 [Gemmatimonadales bacterium]|nr:hypothetical protein [Gemmatimonadales bacterium]